MPQHINVRYLYMFFRSHASDSTRRVVKPAPVMNEWDCSTVRDLSVLR